MINPIMFKCCFTINYTKSCSDLFNPRGSLIVDLFYESTIMSTTMGRFLESRFPEP